MNNSEKSKVELLNEIEELKNENDRLTRSLHEFSISDLKIKEVEFQRTEGLHNAILQATWDGFWLVDTEGKLLEVNEAYCRMSGYTKMELTTMRVTDLEVHESVDEFANHLQKIIRQGDGRFESCHRRKDGTLFDLEVSAMYRKFEGGKLIVFLRDITESKKAETALRKSEERYRNLAENLNELVFEADPYTSQARYVNKAIENIFGYTVEEWLDDPSIWVNSIYPDDRERVLEDSKEARDTLKDGVLTYRIIRKDRSIRWVEERFSWVTDEHGNIILINGLIYDISERKQAELALSESERKYRNLVETAQELIWKCDSNGRFTYLNPAWENSHGYKVEEMLGRSFSDFLSAEISERDMQEFARNMQGVSVREYETNHLTRDGKEITLLFNAIPIIDREGKVIGTQGTAIDITRRKMAEKALIMAKEQAQESDRLKSAFLANMSHEIRTPMNGILGFAGLLKEPKLSGKEQQEYIQIIENSGARMLNIINDIIDISKIESGQIKVDIQESNINQLIEFIYAFFKNDTDAKGLQLFIKNSLPSRESVIKTDREKVFAILTNLVKNAIKFSENGPIEFGYTKKGSNLEFFVRDNGIGIAPDRQQVIFERFIQADNNEKRAYQGAGLGLAITKAYVEMLGGKIWVESELRKGSTFYFTLPYNTRPEEKVAVTDAGSPSETETMNKKLKILIAEDDEISEKLITILVNPFRKEVLIANSGIEAVEKCRNNPDIDLVLMDIQMPGLNGYDATRQIRQFNKDVIIIAQTAFGLTGDREKALEAGCNDYIAKPLDVNLLKKLIRDYFKMASR